jgi:hypothetical protein
VYRVFEISMCSCPVDTPEIPLANPKPVRYTLEVSLRAGILFWKETLEIHAGNSRTALAQRIVPERPLEVQTGPTGEIKQLER